MPLQPNDVEAARTMIRTALAGLAKEEYREVGLKVVYQRKSLSNTAQELGLTHATVYERFVQVLRFLEDSLKDNLLVRSYTDELFDEVQKAVLPDESVAQRRDEAALTPELRQWASQQFTDQDFVAGIREIQETGGFEFRDFLKELEKAAGIND